MPTAQGVSTSEEWRRLKSLRSYRHRLLNATRYRPLNSSHLLSGQIGSQNDSCLLEDGLRNLMRRNDLDTIIDEGLDADTQDQAFALLTSLCAALENMVATDLWTALLSESESKYPRIDRLLQELGKTEWKFHMASESQGRRLFVTLNSKTARDHVDSFNTFFSRLTQPAIQDLEFINAQQTENVQTKESRAQPHEDTKPLQMFLHWLKKLANTTCSKCHDVLLQLPEWNATQSLDCFRNPHLKLYISRCEISEWQEGHLHELANRNNSDWYPARNLCDEIKDLSNRERLTLAAAEGEIYVYARSSDSPDSAAQSSKKPSKTLKQLIQGGAFLGADAWWQSKVKRFEQTEKRRLAATLVLSLSSMIEEDAYFIKSWDPESVYFLSDSQGRSIQSLPYALCLASVPSESASAHFLFDNEHETSFTLLARLLMEIECGVSLEHMQTKTTGCLSPSTDTFEDFIYDQVSTDLSDSRRSYLEAVQMCFRFQQNCRREYKRISARGVEGGQAVAARNLLNKIIQKLRTAVDLEYQSSTFDKTLRRPVADNCYVPSALNNSERLGMSIDSSVSLPLTVVREIPDDFSVRKKLRVSTSKQVRFAVGNSEGIGERYAISGAITYSPVTSIDSYELFGDNNTGKYFDDLRRSSKKWFTDFKRLRRNKTNIHTEQRIKVAVLDTGVDFAHPGIIGSVYDSKSFIDDNTASDNSGHGTHIAGVILDLTTNVDLYIGKVIESSKSDNRRPIVEGLRHAREVWKVDMISLSFGFRICDNPDLVQQEIEACLKGGIVVFASASNDAGNKPRTYPGDYDGVLCIHSATGEGNKSSFNPSPVHRRDNFSFVGDCMKSFWPNHRLDYDDNQGQKYLSGTSIATPVAVSVAVFMINYIRKEFPQHCWNINPLSPEGTRKIFALMAHEREGYDWVSPDWFFTGDQNCEEEIKARLKRLLKAYVPEAAGRKQLAQNS
ncbi:unnamed protein product [Periconia digitata]|uniref:Peptidase S8/S53 domain-containing protein n=1 Tax=Periconia digitata TaxID=1303443 RepID=A0A9W4XHA6_9PLEO|nr:unnamed protein product [Periconia digitata]